VGDNADQEYGSESKPEVGGKRLLYVKSKLVVGVATVVLDAVMDGAEGGCS